MPYVQRDPSGAIVALTESPSAQALEFLEEDTPEVRHFQATRQRADAARETLRASDSDFIRVLEDLIDLLVAKGVITPAELPDAVRAKLARRATLRDRFRASPLLKFDDDVM